MRKRYKTCIIILISLGILLFAARLTFLIGNIIQSRNTGAWQKYGFDCFEIYKPGLWKGDKYDAYIDTSRRDKNSDGHLVYYCEMTINGKKVELYVGCGTYYPLFYDYGTYKTGEFNETVLQANDVKEKRNQ